MSLNNAPDEMRHPVTMAMYTALCAVSIDSAWRFRQTYREPASGDFNRQLDAAFHYWTDQFADYPLADTRDARLAFCGCRDVSDFARLFTEHVARLAVELDLPQCSTPTPKFYRGRPF